MKKIFFTCFIISFQLLHAAAQDTDFTNSTYSIKINTLYNNTLKEIQKIPDKANKTIVLDKNITQDEFNKICSKLKWIQKLSIDNNSQITHLQAISTLTKLEVLRFKNHAPSSHAPIDLAVISKNVLLKELDLSGTCISNEQIIESFPLLEKLYADNSILASLNFLHNTPLLKELSIAGNNHTFEDYTPLNNLIFLRKLNIKSNIQATDYNLSSLTQLSELREITLSNCEQITNLDFLKQARKLEEIQANYCPALTDFTGITRLPSIKKASFEGATFSNTEIVENFSKLQELYLAHSAITNLSGIEHCKNLERLDASHTAIEQTDEIGKLWKLKRLNVSHTNIQTIAALVANSELIDIDISHTQVEDIQALADSKKLSTIDISYTPLTDIKPLYGMQKISMLKLNNKIPQAQIDAIKIRFPLMVIDIFE